MNFKILSSKPQKFLAELSVIQLDVLRIYMAWSKSNPLVTLSQFTIAEMLNVSRRTVNGAVSDLRQMGALITKRRYNNSNIVHLNPKFFSDYDWYMELKNWFTKFPSYLFTISLIFSGIVTGSSHYQELNIKNGRKTHSSLKLSVDPSLEKGDRMSQVVANHAKIRSICLALNARGSCITNDECLNLTAFDVDVLEKACAIMKKSQGVKHPAAFFFAQCRKLSIEKGKALDWGMAQTLRDNNYVLLKPSEERRDFNGRRSQEQKPWQDGENYHKGDSSKMASDWKMRKGLREAEEIMRKKQIADRPVVVENPEKELELWAKELPQKIKEVAEGNASARFFLDIALERMSKLSGDSIEEIRKRYEGFY